MATAGQWKIRSFSGQDLPVCTRLYREGLLGGALSENDTGLDIDDIEAVYMNRSGNHFWVAENQRGDVVGMVGVQRYGQERAGQIRRLRVAKDHRRRGIGSALLEAALKFCQENQYLKVTLDTFVDREAAIRLCKKFHFRHERSRIVSGKELMYFYLDLYGGIARPGKGEEPSAGRGISHPA
ncbi:MAG: GNAT family N-acetyltransferase [Tepidisphaeraceae bacterium]|jgi:ribosomal protein S18 acetylase RimI-like enzyme